MTESPDITNEKNASEDEDKQRTVVLAKVVKQWNIFIRGLLSATAGFEGYRKARLDNAVQLEEFPVEFQKMFMYANPHGDFSLIVEDIMTHPRIMEHLKTLLVPIK